MIGENLTSYVGLRVTEFDADAGDLPPAASVAWKVASEYDGTSFLEKWEQFRGCVDTTEVTALVIGYWGAAYDSQNHYPVPLLVDAAESFPNLRSVFFGDLVYGESEISWIEHEDISPLFHAFPAMERLDVRGGGGLALQPIKSDALRVLRFESGGLPAGVVQAVGASDLPNLEHLDLWLGTDEYGGDATPADLAPFLSGDRFPALRRLGLEDAEFQDEIAAAVAGAPIVPRLESLSLAMGTLTDRGAEALLSGQPLTHLRELDLHHHFLSEAMVERLRAALPDVRIDLEKAPRDTPYIAVSE